ncbi:hypothetical protein ACCUM_1236 [Candidatus Accumulibacter phosphatis]|uniref:Uncharacterized protein n=1 Tax=Candidatus Accumulibacter phosphatis TaxID=327160 RepID=A0A5S4EJH4_9PROT|nr:hypothetical protein ACCUM_1236 [Candidatus Accumulibacter phosphatis]
MSPCSGSVPRHWPLAGSTTPTRQAAALVAAAKKEVQPAHAAW